MKLDHPLPREVREELVRLGTDFHEIALTLAAVHQREKVDPELVGYSGVCLDAIQAVVEELIAASDRAEISRRPG